MPFHSQPRRFFALLALAWVAGGLLALRAAADDRLAGYWVPAPDKPDPAVFSIGQLGKWTIVTQRWEGAGPGAPELKVRYLVTTSGNGGTLTADQPLDKLPDVPRVITYQLEAGQLTLKIDGPAHAGTYELVKGTPPSATRPAPAANATVKMPAMPRAAPTKPKGPPAMSPWERLVGSWVTEPQAGVQVSLHLAPGNAVGQYKINQKWAKGSDSPAMAKAGNYMGSALGGHGVLTKDKADFEGSLIPLVMNFDFEGDALIITVDDGTYAGQHRLIREVRGAEPPASSR